MRSRARSAILPRKLLRGAKKLDDYTGEEIYENDATTLTRDGKFYHQKNYDYLTTRLMEEALQNKLR